jgi:hypothetical protein
MSSIAAIVLSGMPAVVPRVEPAARGGDSAPAPSRRGDNPVAARFRPSAGLVRVEEVASRWTYDPSSPFAARNGLVAAPNADVTEQNTAGPFTGYGLAFNSPIMHLYTRTASSLVNILA